MFRGARAGADDWPEYLAGRASSTGARLLADYFRADCPAPQTPIADVPLVAMDMETTGLDATRHGIVSIGLVPFNLKRIQLAGRRYWVVHPSRALESRSVTFHHITHAAIENAPDLREVLPELLAALAGRVAVVHFRGVERPFLDAAVRERMGESLLFPMIDTMALEARRYRLSYWARLRRWLGRPPVSIRLSDSRARYALPAYHGHHALWDALATAELLQAQIATYYSPATPLGDLWC